MTSPIQLSDLVIPVTPAQALTTELSVAMALSLPVTAWQPLGIASGIMGVNAQLVSNYSQVVSYIAQGGYASYASQMKDLQGNEITTWMDLRGVDQYNVSRIPATYASTDSTGFSVTNMSGATIGPFAVGQLHVQNPTTFATYNNSAAVGTIPNGVTQPIAIIADAVGADSTSGPGTITALLTPIVGVSCTNSAPVVGTDAETNIPYYQRCVAKLGALSPNGPSQAYYYVATSILDPLAPFYNPALTQAITRVTTSASPALVNVYIANAAGSPSGPDTAIVDAAIQQWCVPLGTTAVVTAAIAHVIPVTYTIYVPISANLSALFVTTTVSDALAVYFETIPIGGLTDASNNVVPWSAILAVIKSAVPQAASVTLTIPSDDVTLGINEVAVLGTVTGTPVFT